LLHDAMARGASHDLALGVLGRIDRLDRPGTRHEPEVTTPRTVPRWRSTSQPAPSGVRTGGGQSLALWITVIALVGASGVGAAWWASVTGVSLPEFLTQPGASAGPIVAAPLPDPSPVPAAAERYLLRGRALFASGHLREALVDLERIPLGDPLRPDADRLRGQIQRELLAVAASDMTPVAAAPPRPPE
jgi:hypothetical protein